MKSDPKDEFNPGLHLLAIESNRVELLRISKDQEERIKKFFKELKRNYPLNMETMVVDNFNTRYLDDKIYEIIERWLISKKMSSEKKKFIDDGFLGFPNKKVRTQDLPQINRVLDCVGLVAVNSNRFLNGIGIKPLIFI